MPSGPTLVDTHCHLVDARFEGDRTAVIERSRAAGVHHVIVIADSEDSTRAAIDVARAPGLSATAGVHPHQASSWTDQVAAVISDALADPTVVAVGETGLDYHYDHSPRDVQRRVFAAQLQLAAERGKPVIVHARDADDDVAAMITEWAPSIPSIVLHSFSSGPRVLEAGLAGGAYLSFSGMVTFRGWANDAAVAACPADRLLVETDAPYLAPVPHRGKRNEPAFVVHVAARVADIRGESAVEVGARTTANAVRCFGPRVAPQFDLEPAPERAEES